MNNNSLNQPKKRGKRKALQKARKLDKTDAEILELKIRKSEKYGNNRPCAPSPHPVDEAADDVYFRFCNVENYPLFSHLNRSQIRSFINDWASRCDPAEEMNDANEWK